MSKNLNSCALRSSFQNYKHIGRRCRNLINIRFCLLNFYYASCFSNRVVLSNLIALQNFWNVSSVRSRTKELDDIVIYLSAIITRLVSRFECLKMWRVLAFEDVISSLTVLTPLLARKKLL